MPTRDFLVISRGQWDATASREQVQSAIDEFYDWYERGLAQGRMKPGSRLENSGRIVSRATITDGPFAETKEIVGGYWFIVAGSLDEAAAIAAENPCIAHGLSLEVRPLEAARASVTAVTNETPAAWIAGAKGRPDRRA